MPLDEDVDLPTAADTVVGQIDVEEQQQLVADVREIVRVAPLIRVTAGSLPMSVLVTNAGRWGWIADERGYRYIDKHPSGAPWPAIPKQWLRIAERFAGPHDWDCAHVVVYKPTATLGWHRDKTEHDRSKPVVTISLGDPADWSVRADEKSPISTTVLRSGDVVLLADQTRHYVHRIGKIHSSTQDLFARSPLPKPGRIAISLRSGAGPSE